MILVLGDLFKNFSLAKADLVLVARLINFTSVLTQTANRYIISRFLKVGEE